MTDLLFVVLMLWGLSGGLLYLYRRRLVHGEGWFLLFLGGVLAFAAWRVGPLQPLSVAIPGTAANVISIVPHVVLPAVYLSVLVVYMMEGASTAAWLILGLLGIQFFVGSFAPFVLVLTSGLKLIPGFSLADVSTGVGLRATLSQVLALGVGMYLMIVVYQWLANRFEQRWMVISSWLSLLVSGLIQGGLYAFGASWGTQTWAGVLASELAGWALASVALWPAIGIYIAHLSSEAWPQGPPSTRPTLGVFNQTFALQRALKESQARVLRLNEGLRVLTDARSAIVRSVDADRMLNDVCRRLTRSGYVRLAWVVLTHGPDEEPLLAASSGGPKALLETLDDAGDRITPALQIAEAAASDALPQVVGDTSQPPQDLPGWAVAAAHGLMSTAVVPIRQSGAQLGMLCAARKATQAFDGQSLDLMAGVADDVGYGLRRLALEGQSARRIHELDTLYELGVDLISEHGVLALLQKLIDRSAQLLEADGGAVFQCDSAGRVAECVAVTPGGRIYHGAEVAYGEGPVGRTAEHGSVVNEVGPAHIEGGSDDHRAILAVPLKWQKDVKGVVLVMRPASQPFSGDDQGLLDLLATQAAVALENARLIESERRHSAELEALREASLRMTSNLELNAVLESILEHALKLISAWDAHIFLYDGETLQFASALWAGDIQGSPFSEPRENGLTYTVARTGERLVVEDASTAPIFRDADWEGAIVGIPLRSKDRVLGVMNVAYQSPHRFTGEELRILDLLADQAAVVLENARLFERTEADRRRLRLLYEITRELAASTDPHQILHRALEITKENLGGLLGSIALVAPDTRRMRFGNVSGYDKRDLNWLESKLDMRVGKGFVGWIAEERQAALASDVLEDPRWSPVPGVDDEVRSALGAPIMVDGELLGVMVIFHREPGVFEDEHLELMVAICRQVGLAWTNAQRYRQIERRLAEQTVIQHVAQVITRRMEMGPLLEEIVEQVSSTLGYDYVGVSLVEDDALVLMASRGHDESVFRLDFDQGITGRVARTNLPALVPDVDRDPDFVRYFPGTRSELAVPIRKGDVAIGVLNVESPQLEGLNEDDLRLLSLLADQMAVAIENAALYERLRRHSAELESTVASRTSELAEALDRAQEADRLKTQFVSDVSHELRTPLSNIRLYVELLEQAPLERQPGYVETLKRETERLVTLIEDLLSISRLDAGTSPPELVRLDLNDMSRALVADRHKLFSERGLSLNLELSSPSADVMADENLIAQVIGNLLTNAMHYTPSGGSVTLRTGHSADGEWVKLAVSDTGVGILPEEKAQLFDRFFRGSASRQMKNPGTGLGLAISQEIVDRHLGWIEVESSAGKGSTFTVWLPAVDSRPVPDEEDSG